MIQIHPDIINICKTLQLLVSNYEQEYRELNEKKGYARLSYSESLKKARKNFEKNLQTYLPKEDFVELDNRALSSLQEEKSYKPDNVIPGELFVGTIRYFIKIDADSDFITQKLDEVYGEFIRKGTVLDLPLLLLARTNHLIFIENNDRVDTAIGSVNGFISRYLLKMPLSGVDYYFIDGLKAGAAFGIFSPLKKAGLDIIKNEVADTSASIDQMLDAILNSNNDSGWSVLVIDSFPAQFSAKSLDKLENILQQSTRLRVNVIINQTIKRYVDKTGEISKKIERLKQYMSCFDYESGWLFPIENEPYTISFNKTQKNWDHLLKTYINEADSKNREQGLLSIRSEDNSDLFTKESSILHSIKSGSIINLSPDEAALYQVDINANVGTRFPQYSNDPIPREYHLPVESQISLKQKYLKENTNINIKNNTKVLNRRSYKHVRK